MRFDSAVHRPDASLEWLDVTTANTMATASRIHGVFLPATRLNGVPSLELVHSWNIVTDQAHVPCSLPIRNQKVMPIRLLYLTETLRPGHQLGYARIPVPEVAQATRLLQFSQYATAPTNHPHIVEAFVSGRSDR